MKERKPEVEGQTGSGVPRLKGLDSSFNFNLTLVLVPTGITCRGKAPTPKVEVQRNTIPLRPYNGVLLAAREWKQRDQPRGASVGGCSGKSTGLTEMVSPVGAAASGGDNLHLEVAGFDGTFGEAVSGEVIPRPPLA